MRFILSKVAEARFPGQLLADLTGKDFSGLQLKFVHIQGIFPKSLAGTGFREANTLNKTFQTWAQKWIASKQTWANFAASFR